MAMVISVSRALLPASARRVAVSEARASRRLQRGPRLCRCPLSLVASAAAGASSPPPSDAGAPVWDALGDVSVFAAGTGDAVPLRDLWDPTEGVAVIALLRHFGCFCCWELASDLKASMEKFDSAGAKLIAVGVGTSDKARILADRLPFPPDSLYADPERKAYDVLGLYHGLGRTFFNPASAKIYSRLDSIREATKNYTLEGAPADLTGVLQQGGMFVFRGKELVYAWRDEGTGDHAPLEDVLAACCQAPGFAAFPPTHGCHHRRFAPTPLPRPTVTSSRFRPNPVVLPGRRCLRPRLHRSRYSPATAASSSPVPSSSPEPGSGIGDALGGVAIFSAATGEPVLFRDLWDQNEGIAVVALLRHFGCPCCWELASVLRDTKERFDSAGVKLIAVGVGTPDKARILAERLPFPLDCLYADPERKAYDLLGLYFGIGRTFFNPASVKVFSRFDSLKEAVKNYTIEATPDDRPSVLQQGGMFVFKGKELLYARKDEGTGDHAPLDDVLNICCEVPVT